MYVWYIYLHLPYFTSKKPPNVGKYTVNIAYMDGMGMGMVSKAFQCMSFTWIVASCPMLEKSTSQVVVFNGDLRSMMTGVLELAHMVVQLVICWYNP